MIPYINPAIYTRQFVEKLQHRVEEAALELITITKFTSEGTEIQGEVNTTPAEWMMAIDIYWDEVNGVLITEDRPNFYQV